MGTLIDLDLARETAQIRKIMNKPEESVAATLRNVAKQLKATAELYEKAANEMDGGIPQ